MTGSIPAIVPSIVFVLIGIGMAGAGLRLSPHPFADETPARTRYGSTALLAGGAVVVMVALFIPTLAMAIFTLPFQIFDL